jgi:hypothetical protein
MENELPEQDLLLRFKDYNKFYNIEFISSADSFKFNQINPEFENVVPKESMSFPSFILANIVNVDNLKELEKLKEELLNLDFVTDVVVDNKAFKMFFEDKEILDKYKKIFKIIFCLMLIVFILKILFFLIKSLFKDILLEFVFGALLGLLAYAVICLITIFNQDTVFMLNVQVLYIVVPLSFMVTLLTKEANV